MNRILLASITVLIFASCSNSSSESTPAVNAVNFTTKTITKSTGPCKDSVSVCAKVVFEYPLFTGPDADSLNRLVAIKMGAGYLDTLHHADFGEVAQQFLNSYDTLLKQMSDYTLPWEWTKKAEVFSQSKGMITLHIFNYEFAGGNHPNQRDEYVHYDLLQHRTIGYFDVLENGHEKDFNAIAEGIFRQNFHLGKEEALDSAGFFFDQGRFSLPENYWFTDSGIVFHYNDYELRSHAEGPYDLLIPYGDFEKIRRQHSDRLPS